MICQFRCLGWIKCTILVVNVVNREGYACVRQGICGKNLYLPLKVANSEPKVLEKILF